MTQSAPGKHFRKGLTLVQILRMFPDDATAEAWFIKNRWPNGPVCPHCGSTNIQSGASHPTMPFRCRKCRKRFSVKTGTVMQSSNLGYQVWALAGYLMSTNLKGVSSMKMHRDLGVSYRTAWHLAHRLRETWQRDTAPFSGPVEADETYVGGKRQNMPKAKRKTFAKSRGPVGKTAVIGVKDRDSNQVSARKVHATNRETLQGFVAGHTEPGATVYTDDNAAYRGMPFRHESVNHSAGEYVRGMAHTNGIESFWAMLKRGYQGTFHHFSVKHMDRYIAEFAGRHNIRPHDTADQMADMVRGMVGKRLRYRDLVA